MKIKTQSKSTVFGGGGQSRGGEGREREGSEDKG